MPSMDTLLTMLHPSQALSTLVFLPSPLNYCNPFPVMDCKKSSVHYAEWVIRRIGFFSAFSTFSWIIFSDSCASVFPGVLQGKMKITHLQHMLSLSGETASFCYYSKQDFLLRKIHLDPFLFPVSSGQEVSSQTINGLLFFPMEKQ